MESRFGALDRRTTVAVLMGGIGAEREVSLQSGACVADALEEAGLRVIRADITPDRMDILDDGRVDVFFVALHGEFGEDGQLQQVLEDKHLVYTGSGPQASRLAFDKMESKRLFTAAGVEVPPAVEFKTGSDSQMLRRGLERLGGRFVVKPVRQGSSVGVSIVEGVPCALDVAERTRRGFGDCLVEKHVAGRELTVGILLDRALPIIEIRSKGGFYDYQAKYVDDRTEYLFDTIEDSAVAAEVGRAAVRCFESLGCRDFARVDFILDGRNIPYALEVNTIPGFTRHSLLPKAAAQAGLSMSELCVRIVETTLAGRARPGTRVGDTGRPR